MYYYFEEVPSEQVIDVSDRIEEAYEYGRLRIEDAVKNNIPNRYGYPRNPWNEAYSILTEMAVAEWAGIEDSQMVYFEARQNGRLNTARNADVYDLEVRRTKDLGGSLLCKPTDVVRGVKLVQTMAPLVAGTNRPTGLVYLVGWNYAREQAKAVPSRYDDGSTEYPIQVRRLMNTIGALRRDA